MSAKRFTIAALAAFVLVLSVAFTRAIPSVKAMMAVDDSSGSVSTSTPSAEIELFGTLDSITGSTWVIDGQQVTVTNQTEVKDTLAVGDFVKVHVSSDANGVLVAREVEAAVSDQNDNVNDNSQDDIDDINDDHGNDSVHDLNDDQGNDNSSTDDQSNSNSNDSVDDDDSGSSHGGDDDDHDDDNSNESHGSDDDHDDDDDHSGSDD